MLEEPDPQRFLELSRTKDGAYVAINSNSKTDSEVWLQRACRDPWLPEPLNHAMLNCDRSVGEPTVQAHKCAPQSRCCPSRR